jgi:hypothetical protein
MALVVKDRVKETTSTTGTGTLTLAGAVTKFQSFSVIGDGNTTYYAIESGNGTDWEVGVGTYTASGTTLSRDTILESSNAGSAINLSGTSTVFCTYPAERSVNTADIGTTIQAYDATILKSADIGSTVQGYDADTAKYDDTTANFIGTLQNGGSNVVVDTDIGSTVQAYDADTAKYDDVTANFTGTLQQGGSNVLTANQTITLSGDATGSGTTAITVTVVDDSHNHIINNVDGLQTELDGKQPLDADLTAIAGLANTDGNFIVGNGTTWVAESGDTARTSLGLGTGDSPSFTGLTASGDVTIADKIIHSGDTNTAIRFPAADTVTVETAGAERMRIDSSGNLQFNSGYGSVQTAFGCRAWVNFDGAATPTVNGSGNISSVVQVSSGVYGITLSTAMPDINYVISNCGWTGGQNVIAQENDAPANRTTTYFEVVYEAGGGTKLNNTYNSVMVLR